MKKSLIITLLIVLMSSATNAQQGLPKEVQADLKQQEIINALKSQNFQAAQTLFEEYDAFGVTMPPPLMLLRAQSQFQVNDFIGTKSTLEAYLSVAQRGSEDYNKALSMYSSIGAKADQQLAEKTLQEKIQKEQQQTQEKLLVEQALVNLPSQMVVIPTGQFIMGSESGGNDEQPVREVSIEASFKLSKHETAFALWDKCVADGGCSKTPDDEGWGRGNRPVINVSWEDIQEEFLPWLNSVTNGNYRLPTEAEWEYAARAGTTTKYSWGDQEPSCEQARFDGGATSSCNYENQDGSYRGTAGVGSYLPNDLVYMISTVMSGNGYKIVTMIIIEERQKTNASGLNEVAVIIAFFAAALGSIMPTVCVRLTATGIRLLSGTTGTGFD